MREGLAETRTAAQALILAGRVLVEDEPCDKPGTRVAPEKSIRLKGGPRPFVSRGGDKLAAALDDLGLDPGGLVCLDVGASTGGFTSSRNSAAGAQASRAGSTISREMNETSTTTRSKGSEKSVGAR